MKVDDIGSLSLQQHMPSFSLMEVCFQGTLALSNFRGSNGEMKDLKCKSRTENGKLEDNSY